MLNKRKTYKIKTCWTKTRKINKNDKTHLLTDSQYNKRIIRKNCLN